MITGALPPCGASARDIFSSEALADTARLVGVGCNSIGLYLWRDSTDTNHIGVHLVVCCIVQGRPGVDSLERGGGQVVHLEIQRGTPQAPWQDGNIRNEVQPKFADGDKDVVIVMRSLSRPGVRDLVHSPRRGEFVQRIHQEAIAYCYEGRRTAGALGTSPERHCNRLDVEGNSVGRSAWRESTHCTNKNRVWCALSGVLRLLSKGLG